VGSYQAGEPASREATPAEALSHGGEIDLPGGPDAVLLLHGLTGSTFELHPLAAHLHAAGLRVLAPVMAGHGGAPEALRGLPWNEWVAKAARDLARLRGARRTLVVGMSMGGLVACELAHDHPGQVDGLALLAPAVELTFPGKLAAFLGRTGPLRRWVVPKGGSDVIDAEMRRRNRGLSALPVGAVAELEALSRHVAPRLAAIRTPALVIVGGRDRTVTQAGARRLAGALGSGPAPVHVLRESAHLLAIDVERARCADEVLAFYRGLPDPHVPERPPGRE
jgi:carboxylesterase